MFFGKEARNALLPPDFLPGPLWMFAKMVISLLKVTIYGFHCRRDRGVVAMVDDSPRHAAEDRLDHVKELSTWWTYIAAAKRAS